MPFAATLYVSEQRRLAKAVVRAAANELHLLSGFIGAKMEIESRKELSAHEDAKARIQDEVRLLVQDGYVSHGEHLVAAGLIPKQVPQGDLQLSDVGCLGIGSSSPMHPGWNTQMVEALKDVPGIPVIKASQDQLSIQDGEHWISLIQKADGNVRGSYPRIPSAFTAVAVFKIAQELKLNLVRMDTSEPIDPMDITSKNWLLQNSQNWVDLEDFAAELGLVKKQIRLSKVIEGGDAFF